MEGLLAQKYEEFTSSGVYTGSGYVLSKSEYKMFLDAKAFMFEAASWIGTGNEMKALAKELVAKHVTAKL